MLSAIYFHYLLQVSVLSLVYEKYICCIPVLLLCLQSLSRYVCSYHYDPGWFGFTSLA